MLEVGLLHTAANSSTSLQSQNLEQNTILDEAYNLKEQNTSGYLQLSGIVKKVSWLAGIRTENTIINGKYKDASANLIDKKYTNFFPKLQAEIEIDSTKILSFNYTKSISRPNYSETSNGQTYINPYFVFSGNINLNPALSDELFANFQYKNKSVKLTYYTNKDVMNYGFQYNATSRILNYRPENFDLETGYNIEFTIPLKYRFWRSDNVLIFNVNKYEDNSATVGNTNPYLYYFSNQTFNLKKDWTISIGGWGLTNRSEGIFEREAMFVLDSSISKKYKTWTCTLSYNNIFKGGEYKEKIQNNFLNSQATFSADTFELSVALKYTFGKFTNSSFKEKVVDENGNRVR
jgi:hypothetical protein